ncbi:MAG TPA: ubiquinol-cytochrome c reductase iron-sulfur subunit [Gammaproteobacteria bacterium]|nr:ubiquinol-cytochrome c reductase iron-sulfur subunit [Gammaproteobacteria bacterium]
MTSKTPGTPTMDSIKPEPATSQSRRRFLVASVGVVGAAAAGLFADVLVDNMNPGKAVAAQGAPVDVDVSKIEPGQLIMVAWKKKPIWILHRKQWMLDTLSKPSLLQRLRDPDSQAAQQPSSKYINGNFRAVKPDMFVAVALCTHMQCIPDYRPTPHTVTPWWYGGFHCPCHGSTYDFSARVFEGSPAPVNIPIPPYYWKSDTIVRIGESNSDGLHEDWNPDIW